MKTTIISAFPACGKTYFFQKHPEKCIDSDSSLFNWIVGEDGIKVRNPDFPNNYIQHIKEQMGKYKFVFVSSHYVVRKLLEEHNLKYTLVYPDKSLKEEWIERFKNRGNDSQFIAFIGDNWECFIGEIEEEKFPNKIKLSEKHFLSDVL